MTRPLTILTLLLAVALGNAGCTTFTPLPDPQPAPPVVVTNVAPVAADLYRGAVCIGLAECADGKTCPGADIDAANVHSWCADFDSRILRMDGTACWSQIKDSIRWANKDASPQDLLVVSLSGHGGQTPDLNGDEADGMDETIKVWDRIVTDDEVWEFICTLRTCRLLLITDTCHSEGNWRKVRRWTIKGLTLGMAGKREWVQMDLDLGLPRSTTWAGQIIQIAGCAENKSSFGDSAGGKLTMTLGKQRTAPSNTDWFDRTKANMPRWQVPVWTEYNLSDSFRNERPLR